MGNTFIQDIRSKAAQKFPRVAFPDAEDVRTLKAALGLRELKIAQPLLVGKSAAIAKVAQQNTLSIVGFPVVDPLV
jgi:phosphotransacetylase